MSYGGFLPSGDDVLAVAVDVDDDSPAGLGGGLVGDFGMNMAMLDLVAVEIRFDYEIIDAV